MQCLQLTRGDAPSTGVTVELSGTFDSAYAYVTIGGTKYTSAQTLEVELGTEVKAYVKTAGSSSNMAATRILLNGDIKAKADDGKGGEASYSFTITSNCKIEGGYMSRSGKNTIAITMPA